MYKRFLLILLIWVTSQFQPITYCYHVDEDELSSTQLTSIPPTVASTLSLFSVILYICNGKFVTYERCWPNVAQLEQLWWPSVASSTNGIHHLFYLFIFFHFLPKLLLLLNLLFHPLSLPLLLQLHLFKFSISSPPPTAAAAALC